MELEMQTSHLVLDGSLSHLSETYLFAVYQWLAVLLMALQITINEVRAIHAISICPASCHFAIACALA
jgi:hypothetical protein